MSKTFREVIRDIKPNEIYRCHVKGMGHIEISCNENNSIIISTPYGATKIKFSYDFEKVRNRVSFDTAFKEFLNGKEIESYYSKNKYKLINGIYHIKLSDSSEWKGNGKILISEIADDWYIND